MQKGQLLGRVESGAVFPAVREEAPGPAPGRVEQQNESGRMGRKWQVDHLSSKQKQGPRVLFLFGEKAMVPEEEKWV